MLIDRSQLSFNFQGARYDLTDTRDRQFLGWVFNQFLYGEVTGIQCGYWLYRAPHLNAATFLAKQAGEELSHVRKILRILHLLGESPAAPHPAIRFLSTGMMGGSWGEHVALEMALGEGLVLTVFYALADTISHPEISKLLDSALAEEESHVRFGERETRAWLEQHPGDRSFLLAQAVLQSVALRFLKRFVLRTLRKTGREDHGVLRQFSEFYDHTVRMFERRVELLGISPRPMAELSPLTKAVLVLAIPFHKVRARFRRRRLLTDVYLEDPMVHQELKHELKRS
ncbi:MAG: ferritin-like domain-containing protein [Bacteriovoracia bacterium]